MGKKINSSDITAALRNYFQNYDYKLENSYIFPWESDFFAVAKTTGYFYEVEIKISRSDFKADFKNKTEKHELFARRKEKMFVKPDNYSRYEDWNYDLDEHGKYKYNEAGQVIKTRISTGIHYIYPQQTIPNCFYYVCPAGLIKSDEVPDYAGLLYMTGSHVYLVKKAPFLHKNNLMTRKRAILLDKFYWLGINADRERRFTAGDLKYTKERLRTCEAFLTRYGINSFTGKKLDRKNPESYYNFYKNFLVFILEKIKVKPLKEQMIWDIVQEYQNPALKNPQIYKPTKNYERNTAASSR